MSFPDTPATPGRPAFSPDGRWWWDGARWVPVTALAPGARPAAPPRPRTPRWALVAAGLGVVALLVTGVLAVVLPAVRQARDVAGRTPYEVALRDATATQEVLFDQSGRYGTTEEALVVAGFLEPSGIDVVLVRADASTYCLASGPAGGTPVVWADESGTFRDESC